MRTRSLLLPLAAAAATTLAACGGDEETPPRTPHLEVDRESVSVSAFVGTEVQESLILENRGLETLIISSVHLEGDTAAFLRFDGPTLTAVPARQRAFLRVFFKPGAVRSYSGTLTIASNAQNAPSKQIALSGVGARQP